VQQSFDAKSFQGIYTNLKAIEGKVNGLDYNVRNMGAALQNATQTTNQLSGLESKLNSLKTKVVDIETQFITRTQKADKTYKNATREGDEIVFYDATPQTGLFVLTTTNHAHYTVELNKIAVSILRKLKSAEIKALLNIEGDLPTKINNFELLVKGKAEFKDRRIVMHQNNKPIVIFNNPE
jgi:hypothetical protein